ncbi:MAG: hypothetical protein HKN91_03380 [Acidimicrobiia bacterium]|nr:hypothetical protein [Acidimicrobiia bacterium]
MQATEPWKSLGWRHTAWELVRYYCSLRGKNQKEEWLRKLDSSEMFSVDDSSVLPVDRADIDLVLQYVQLRPKLLNDALGNLRAEEEALAYCKANAVVVGTTGTKSTDHHQSSKALVAAVSAVARAVCSSLDIELSPDPQRRCVWCRDHHLHVTARNLDGAIPSLANPVVIWEIKEYWGKTSGGSKMSDAVYECNLVGRELREYEERSGVTVEHIVFVDGREQWNKRKSDLSRFLDLLHQGLIDNLLIGRQVETDWEPALRGLLS